MKKYKQNQEKVKTLIFKKKFWSEVGEKETLERQSIKTEIEKLKKGIKIKENKKVLSVHEISIESIKNTTIREIYL